MIYEKAAFTTKDREPLLKLIEFFKDYQRQYNENYKRVGELDRYTQDILHSLELDKLTGAERSKLATKLKHVRQDRRYHKDRVEALEPIVNMVRDSKNTGNVNLNRFLNQVEWFIKTQTSNTRKYNIKIKELENVRPK